MLYEGNSNELLDCTLSLALEEIADTIRPIHKYTEGKHDPAVSELCLALGYYFDMVQEQVNKSSMDNETMESLKTYAPYLLPKDIQDNRPFEDGSVTSDDDNSSRGKIMYDYPQRYIDEIFSMTSENAMKILPYLLAVYYSRYPSNRTIDKGYDSEQCLFQCNPLNLKEENFTRTLNAFLRNFTAKKMVDDFLRKKRSEYIKDIRFLKTKEDIISLLHRKEFTALHYEKILLTFIYSLCVFCCTQQEELSLKIDYALSADLFNEHTLAFETGWVDGCEPRISDFFIPKCYNKYIDYLKSKPKVHSDILNQFIEMDICLNDLILAGNPSDSDLAQKACVLLSVLLHPNHYLPFGNSEFLQAALKGVFYKKYLQNDND